MQQTGVNPPNCYSWRQRFVLLAGAPIIVFALIGSRVGFAFYTADRLEAQQTVSGKSMTYQLTIPDPQWRQLALGTLYPDTDLELLNQQLNEWVVVRVVPSQSQPLDSFVDQRKAIIAAKWKRFAVEETRAFLSGSELMPLSLAQYIQTGTTNSRESPLLVATLVTPDQVFEVIGHGSNKPGSRVTDLVKSFSRLLILSPPQARIDSLSQIHK
jgi:phage-related protein